ncbi:MAG: uroporphyrinogen-III C-methyltransferase [Thermoleophilia bacterium]|nr:uroporphyrinogen-III C-methyltransferase [Thermoleophilia bacterium]
MSAARRGTVYLCGAGPGDLGLVTGRTRELVESADVLLVDRLIPKELRTLARADAEIIDVGKTAGNHAMPQDEINDRLVEEALAGRSVVRVKGGDPYLFGRGGEEAMRCRAAKVPFEVVPGVTSAFAACAAAGIPVTHRDLSRHVTVVTASAGRDGQGDPDYEWLARSDGTIVLLMGLRRVGHVAAELVASGMIPSKPCAVVSRGTTGEQRVVTGTLSTIEGLVLKAGLASPAIIVVGDVVELREHLAWFERRPLFRTRIAVTRARAQSSELVTQLTDLGASVVEVPAIRIEPLDPAEIDAVVDRLHEVQTVVFTSRNGVDRVFARLVERGLDARVFGSVERIAVVGSGTADALAAHGLRADVLPPEGSRTAHGLLETLVQLPLFGTRCAIFRAERGDDRLPDGLRGIDVDVLLARCYRTVVQPATAEQVDALLAADVVTFSSASTVTNAVAMVPDASQLPPCVTIGPTTTAAALEHRLTVLQQAPEPSITGIVAAVVERALDNQGISPWRNATAGATA